MKHVLKTDPEVYDASKAGTKSFELRFNDRRFCAGDILVLKRTHFTGIEMAGGAPLIFTEGEELWRQVTYVLGGYGLQPGWVILAVQSIQGGTIWYMRDNCTFLPLPLDVNAAIEAMRAESDKSGMLCTKFPGFKTVHARGEKHWPTFEAEARAWIERACREML